MGRLQLQKYQTRLRTLPNILHHLRRAHACDIGACQYLPDISVRPFVHHSFWACTAASLNYLLKPAMLVQTRLQLPRGDASPELFRGLYDGVLPPLLAGLPSGEIIYRQGARAHRQTAGQVSAWHIYNMITPVTSRRSSR